MALVAAFLCSTSAAFAVDANPAPQITPDDSNFFTRLYHAYAGEWGMPSAPADPNAPPGPPIAVPAAAGEFAALSIYRMAGRWPQRDRQLVAQRGR
jgi:hypothetical protein